VHTPEEDPIRTELTGFVRHREKRRPAPVCAHHQLVRTEVGLEELIGVRAVIGQHQHVRAAGECPDLSGMRDTDDCDAHAAILTAAC
jgi:hypothetical protein